MKKTSNKTKLILGVVLLLTGCHSNKTTASQTPPQQTKSFTLNSDRIQVNQYETINYLDYISGDKEDVQYTPIDTTNLGTYEVEYTLPSEDENTEDQDAKTLIVDVVRTYDNEIFNPTDVIPETISNPESITALVNKTHKIPEGWVPDDLVEVAGSHQQLRQEAAQAFQEFYDAAQSQGITCYIISGYRSNETQALYWQRQVEIYGEEYASQYSAYPGRSEHQLGLAIDISNQISGDRLTEQVADSDIGKFIISDGYKYGFILRYPQDKVSITNYGYEPWHMRYVGKEAAQEIHQRGITFEEYIEESQS
ncbi:D-alanyl-D-alanine carboxypeptidase family protein [uncultured Thomasclavelia sp.]|uniref:M15 family metallopeptidase n=1 Tax=uncultured Thomasclavelia sp. TaxID=3025759 RepID=UPI0025F6642F|nr:M15 family metallopeptidase [uncultured Thomasclavelia sp.]